MFSYYVSSWWAVALRGLLVLLFGVVAFVWPGATLATLLFLFGAFAITEGVLTLASLFMDTRTGSPWLVALHGTVNILIGVATFVWPGATTLALLYMLAAWAILNGVVAIVAAIELRKELDDAWLLGLSGGAALIFGVLVVVSPGISALVLLGYIAAYALISGIMMIVLGLRLRRMENKVKTAIQNHAAVHAQARLS